MPQLLLELFSEEIPARMQAQAARDLERMASERLKAAGLVYEALTTFAGPRRLTLVVEGLPAATPDRFEELKGPKTSAPEQALEGFLRKTGLTREQLTERDGVLYAVIEQKGERTKDILGTMLWSILGNFPWPKSMRWGTGSFRWVRPLKRIVFIFDGEIVHFSETNGAQEIESSDVTEGHRFMTREGVNPGPFRVTNFETYRQGLTERFVEIDREKRKADILSVGRANCAMLGLELVEDEGLADEVAGLVEFPVPTVGDMDPAFLDLPPEVIQLSMKVHQKYFAVRDPKTGRLAPNFVVVANVETDDQNRTLAAGNSRVLSARLNDARFFWDEDKKVGFDAWLKKLEGVTFHAKLGTMAERVERIAALAREIAPLVGADPDQAETAARLAKGDLASGMVGEFPELQGIMGGYYARAEHGDAIADAIRDHYKPQGPNDAVPTAPLTVAVALADKLDTLVGFFAIDEKPTGSKDPFALRRAALGVIRLVLENGVRVSFEGLLTRMQRGVQVQHFLRHGQVISISRYGPGEQTTWASGISLDQMKELAELAEIRAWLIEVLRGSPSLDRWRHDSPMHGRQSYSFSKQREQLDYANDTFEILRDEILIEVSPPLPDAAVQEPLLTFFADRLKVLLRDQGKRHDLVDAVFALGDDDLVRIVRRVEALDAFLATDDGANLLAGYKRASNILKAEEKKGPLPVGAVATDLPNQPVAESALVAAVERARGAVDQALVTEDFAAAMTALAGLRAPVDAFFTDVMVNSDVPAERENRLKLLGQVREVMGRVADFGQVAG